MKFMSAVLLVAYLNSCAGTSSNISDVSNDLSVTSKGSSTGAKIVSFAKSQKGKKVGDGECYAMVDVAYRSLGLTRPAPRKWGRVVDWKTEGLNPGDIIEFKSAVYPEVTTGKEHTAIVISGNNSGYCTVYEQNVNGIKKVVKYPYHLGKLISGSATVYRYE